MVHTQRRLTEFMEDAIIKKYSDDKEWYYEISRRNDGDYQMRFFQKIVDEYRGKVTVTYHDVGNTHITDTLESAIEFGDGMIEKMNRADAEENI